MKQNHDVVAHLPLQFRKDINGLRAVAVLIVILFHAFPTRIKGGFIGVDIFFVISGFLISTIIFKGLQKNEFSFLDFYQRRVRRIFPSLLLVLASLYCFGWFYLLGDEYKQLGKHIFGGASFISNFILWNESSYFDNAADTKPLLHLWSLGIEEQFYIICPLLFWCAWRRHISFLVPIVMCMAASLSINLYLMHENPVADFYSPLSRFWELMIGSGLAWYKLRPNTQSLFNGFRINGKLISFVDLYSICGLLLITCGILLINKHHSFPGYLALVPTVGAALIIGAGERAWVNKLLLSNKLLNWIGLISFPLYLWHWPLLSLARVASGGPPNLGVRVSLIVLAFILATLTYYLLEIPIRWGSHHHKKNWALLSSGIMTMLMGYDVYIHEGYKLRSYPVKLNRYLSTAVITARKDECFEIPFAYNKKDNWYCTLGKKSSKHRAFA